MQFCQCCVFLREGIAAGLALFPIMWYTERSTGQQTNRKEKHHAKGSFGDLLRQRRHVSDGCDTVREMIAYATGGQQIHLVAHTPRYDTSTRNNRSIYYGGFLYPPADRFNLIDTDYVGGHLERYNSLLVLSHFKGHPMGGYDGALKQLSIGVPSAYGKAYIYGAGEVEKIWTADHDSFLEAMADAAAAVAERFGERAAYINVMANMSVDCDCCAVAEDPCMADIGVLASTDPVAIDQACLDLVYAAKDDPGQAHLLERIESRNGVHTVEAAAALGVGSREYELILVD